MFSMMEMDLQEFGDFPDLFSNDLLVDAIQDTTGDAACYHDPLAGPVNINQQDEDIQAIKKENNIFHDFLAFAQEVNAQQIQETPTTPSWSDSEAVSGPVSPSYSTSSGFGDEDVAMNVNDTQTLISEMEEFLVAHETQSVDNSLDSSVDSLSPKVGNDRILDDLMTGNVTVDFKESQNNTSVLKGIEQSLSGCMSINNISEIITEDGQKIVIVIANDSFDNVPSPSGNTLTDQSAPSPVPLSMLAPSPQSSYASPSPASTFSDDTADSDWSPSTNDEAPGKQVRKTIGARAAKRGPYKRSTHSTNIKDKKERKKLQNVEAARRYRDKKKNEQSTIETEESILEKRNLTLQGKVSDIESEIKTLKKLMVELGLIKVE
ncbi:hypothetical protein TCAL_02459 [Tigriopus californicus]|uniref:BZIP domain-containing protein n=1 Tax=Tigriopus californicus TaxID=6832 RepID=A0A553NTF4_TIGCA|nr:uncharacterized protein LOC131877981 [Tigriopus californicus]TRY68703.1 hypothetical protein TCAL_02459 [Tigriopus californicus]|eukprot:TCALIF_02459-PA protein Name:"Similar to ATFC Activating transcription factor of chaperone (Bombyx mori)" AED:0.00 eAED:0.00 QI:284/1/1/1/1/0.75/4/495/376